MSCVICLDDFPAGAATKLCCASNHPICDDCFGRYLLEQADKLGKTNLLASKAQAAEIAGDRTLTERLAGLAHCPLRGHGCDAPPFDDRQVALHAGIEPFKAYLHGKTQLPTAQRVQTLLQKRAEMTSLFPNARQCARCGFGPVELAGCADLASHHGQVMSGSSVPIDNACRRCGWFSPHIRQWPKWEPTALEATEDPLQAVFAEAAADETDEAAAARREARQAELLAERGARQARQAEQLAEREAQRQARQAEREARQAEMLRFREERRQGRPEHPTLAHMDMDRREVEREMAEMQREAEFEMMMAMREERAQMHEMHDDWMAPPGLMREHAREMIEMRARLRDRDLQERVREMDQGRDAMRAERDQMREERDRVAAERDRVAAERDQMREHLRHEAEERWKDAREALANGDVTGAERARRRVDVLERNAEPVAV